MTQKRFLAVLLAFFLALAACSSSDETTDAAVDGTASADGISAGSGSDSDDATTATTEAATEQAPATEAPADETTDDTTTGDTTDGSDADAAEAVGDIKQARLGDRILARTSTVERARFESIISLEGDAEFPDGVEFQMSGAYDLSSNASEIELDFGSIFAQLEETEDLGPFAALLEEPMIVRSVGETAYVSWPLLTLFTGSDATWIATPIDEADSLTSSVGPGSAGSPLDFLSALEEANAELTVLGTEDVRGVATTHYRALVDLAELDASLTDDERAELESELGSLDTSAYPIEFWVDDEGQLRRYMMDIEDAEEGTSGSVMFEIFDYGADISIEAPPAEDVVSSEELDLEGFGF